MTTEDINKLEATFKSLSGEECRRWLRTLSTEELTALNMRFIARKFNDALNEYPLPFGFL